MSTPARFGAVLLAGLLIAAAPSPPDVQAPDIQATARNDVTVLGFVRRTPLSPDEQAAVARYVAERYANNPKDETKGAGGAAFAAQIIAGPDQRKRAIVREMYRAQIEARAADDAERRIVVARDPTIVYDPNSKMVVSERTLDDVMAAAAWAARVLEVPPPPPSLRTEARDILISQFATFDHANQEAYAHILRNLAVAMPILRGQPPAAQKAALLRWGKPDEIHDTHRLLAMTMATMEFTAWQASGGGGGGGGVPNRALAMLHAMTLRNLSQSTWQIRHPECGPVGSNPSSCGQAPILQPITPPFP